jgi:sulfide:quinone oxidoreductase
MKRVLILGGGTGGAVAASRLGKWARSDEVEVVLVDRSPWHEYRPSYLWVATGKRTADDVRRPLEMLTPRYGTRVVQASVTAIQPDDNRVQTDHGSFEYDYLIVSLGAALKDDPAVQGLEAPWELQYAEQLRERLRHFDGGKVLVGPLEWPYRCPPAPFEVAFLLKYLADQRHLVDRTQITVLHPWEKPLEWHGDLVMVHRYEHPPRYGDHLRDVRRRTGQCSD